MTVLSTAYCRHCGGSVRPNLDHVGNCASGDCSGTYEHVRLKDRARCRYAFSDLGHKDVKEGR
jgi:hypothetical protein